MALENKIISLSYLTFSFPAYISLFPLLFNISGNSFVSQVFQLLWSSLIAESLVKSVIFILYVQGLFIHCKSSSREEKDKMRSSRLGLVLFWLMKWSSCLVLLQYIFWFAVIPLISPSTAASFPFLPLLSTSCTSAFALLLHWLFLYSRLVL